MSTATNENSTAATSVASDELPVHEVNLTDVAAGKVRSLLEQEG
ncbi:MAG: iron-sulfur cluster insertion protein ErpA, partial [Actinomycetes bacterium]